MLLWDGRKKERMKMNKNEFMLAIGFRYIGNEMVWGFGEFMALHRRGPRLLFGKMVVGIFHGY